jgi:hypothetical protein
MKKIISLVFMVGLSLGLMESASAHGGTRTPRVTHRQHRQQRRIGQGLRSGELTTRETLRLERNEREIQRDKREAKSDGRVTARERVQLHRELNRSSRHIYRAKHNNHDRN